MKVSEILSLKTPPSSLLVSPADNPYDFRFTEFRIRDPVDNSILFHISEDPAHTTVGSVDFDRESDPLGPIIKYTFPKRFLDLDTVATSISFCNGDQPIQSFRMIERFHFRGKLIKEFDFSFGFVIPNTTNSMESIYPMPYLKSSIKKQIMENPFETISDSFYFVGDELVMHNRALYAFE
ncbi:hypothetical protein RCL1_006356 [Eukaryota sp. TZLM3-RCL]